MSELKFKMEDPADLPQILKIKEEAHGEFVRHRPDIYQESEILYTDHFLKRFFEQDDHYIQTAFSGTEMAAYAFLQVMEVRLPMMTDRKYLYVHDLAVRGAFQGNGIATRLMEQIDEVARGLDIKKIELDVHVFSEGAIRLYEKNGFTTRTMRMEKTLP